MASSQQQSESSCSYTNINIVLISQLKNTKQILAAIKQNQDPNALLTTFRSYTTNAENKKSSQMIHIRSYDTSLKQDNEALNRRMDLSNLNHSPKTSAYFFLVDPFDKATYSDMNYYVWQALYGLKIPAILIECVDQTAKCTQKDIEYEKFAANFYKKENVISLEYNFAYDENNSTAGNHVSENKKRIRNAFANSLAAAFSDRIGPNWFSVEI